MWVWVAQRRRTRPDPSGPGQPFEARVCVSLYVSTDLWDVRSQVYKLLVFPVPRLVTVSLEDEINHNWQRTDLPLQTLDPPRNLLPDPVGTHSFHRKLRANSTVTDKWLIMSR